MEFLKIWEKVKSVPAHALKMIMGGRLKGMSDISPIWRYEKATEIFGPCGIGWKYEIINIYKDNDNQGQQTINIQINFYYKWDGEWSAAIPAIGGSDLIAIEKNGPFFSNEAYKMALTDALSVSLKMLGFGADVYSGANNSKYSTNNGNHTSSTSPAQDSVKIWLTKDQFESALRSDKKGIEATLSKYNGKEFAMNKIFREELTKKLKEL